MKFLLVSNSKNYGKILWPVVIGLGWLLNQVFIFETKILHFPETGSVALAITILTFVIYMALFPLTWKQQKFSILSKKMNPEIQKIQKKYQGKRDQASMAAMQEETQAVYDKYGISPMGSCVQLLIQFPILISLYRVFYNIKDFINATDNAYMLFGLSISKTPVDYIKANFHSNFGIVILALLFPVLSYVSNVIQMKASQASMDENDPTMKQMKIMNITMPFMSLFFAFTVPLGLTVYWIIGAVVRTVQQVLLNKHFEKIDLNEIIEKNKEKAALKAEKRGIKRAAIYNAANISTRNTLSSHASTDTKIKEEELEKAFQLRKTAKKGSLASMANMVEEYNNRNNK